jgi:hypothetical protein
MSEQARKVKSETIPQWADGLYYNKGVFDEVFVYYDDKTDRASSVTTVEKPSGYFLDSLLENTLTPTSVNNALPRSKRARTAGGVGCGDAWGMGPGLWARKG